MDFVSLPVDILFYILHFLPIPGVLALQQTCKLLYYATDNRSLWYSLFTRDVQGKDLPIPGIRGKSYDTFSTSQLKATISRTLQLRRRWNSAFPSPVMTYPINAITGTGSSRLVGVHLVAKANHSYLIVSINQPPFVGIRSIECWNIESSVPRCVARRRVDALSDSLRYVVNSDNDSPALLACRTSAQTVEILGLNRTASSLDSAFVTLSTISKRVHTLHAFHGVMIISRGPNSEHDPAQIWDLRKPSRDMELSGTRPREEDLCFQVLLEDDFALVLQTDSLVLYPLTGSRHNAHVDPIIRFNFQWRIDSGKISRLRKPTGNSPVVFLVRFNSGFPWPVNMIHHYTLFPNPAYDSFSPLTINNMPFSFPPIFTKTISAPVRLFGMSAMAIGSYGSAVWLDTHLDDFYDGQAPQGQRIAGVLLNENIGTYSDEESPSVTTSHAQSVYATQVENTWSTLDLDEEEGCIAVGTTNGVIKILKYV